MLACGTLTTVAGLPRDIPQASLTAGALKIEMLRLDAPLPAPPQNNND